MSTYISNLRSQITSSFVKFGCSVGIFLNSTNLIRRSMDISKCFRGSLRLRDNERRLYICWHEHIHACLKIRHINLHKYGKTAFSLQLHEKTLIYTEPKKKCLRDFSGTVSTYVYINSFYSYLLLNNNLKSIHQSSVTV